MKFLTLAAALCAAASAAETEAEMIGYAPPQQSIQHGYSDQAYL